MIRLIVSSFEKFMAAALWLLFIGAGGAGYLWNGIVGAGVALTACFVFAVLFVVPVLILSDMRRTLSAIEKRLAGTPRTAGPSAPALTAVPHPSAHQASLGPAIKQAPPSEQSETKPAETAESHRPAKTVLRAMK